MTIAPITPILDTGVGSDADPPQGWITPMSIYDSADGGFMIFGFENDPADIQRLDNVLCGTEAGSDMSGVMTAGPFVSNVDSFVTFKSVPAFAVAVAGVLIANGNTPGARGFVAYYKNGTVYLADSEWNTIDSADIALSANSRIWLARRKSALLVSVDTGAGWVPVIMAIDETFDETTVWYIGFYVNRLNSAGNGFDLVNFGGGDPTAMPLDAGSLAEEMYSQLPQSLRDIDITSGYALLVYLGAIGQMLQNLDYLAHAPVGGTLWQNLVDLDLAPDYALPWLGQFVGVKVDTALPAADQRQQIRDHVGWGRGSVSTFKASARPSLTGTKTVDITERTTDADHFTVNTYSDETPDEDATLALLVAAKPAGLIMTYIVLVGSPAGATYGDLYDRGLTYGDIYDEFETYGDIR